MKRALLLLVAVCLCACSDDDDSSGPAPEPLEIPEGCNPIAADADCLLPYPSDQFRGEDGTVALTDAAKLKTPEGHAFDLLGLHPSDGWSFGSQILALFPGGVRGDELIGYYDDDPTLTLTDQSPTQILNAESGERVLHFAEVDPRAESDDRRALVLRPIERLSGGARYVVAIRGLVDPAGAPVAPPEGFRRIRDAETRGDPVLDPLRKRYDSEIFPVLEQAGIARDSLQLAWDFTVRSEESATRDMLAIRSDVIERLSQAPPKVTVTDVEDAPSESTSTFRRVNLTVTVPLYVDSAEPEARLNRDASGNVIAKGETEVPFSVWIPNSVGERAAGTPPARLLQFGHGFFGSREEVNDYAASFGDERGFVVVAADWWGMSNEDRIKVVERLLAEPENTLIFTDRVHQAMANFMYVAAAAKGPVASLPELQVPAGAAYDPSTLYFYGISMGHILGGTYAALAPEVERVALSVGGANFSLMLFRAAPFSPFLIFIGTILPDPLDQQKLGAMLQHSFDRVDPLTYAPYLRENTFEGSPPSRQILLQIGMGDHAVPNLAAHLHARALGIDTLSPAPRPIPALEALPPPLESAIVEFDFGVSPWPDRRAVPPQPPGSDDTDVHEATRRAPAAKEQIDRFFHPDGQIEATCDGVCDPD